MVLVAPSCVWKWRMSFSNSEWSGFLWCSRTKASHLWKLSNSEISSSAHLYSSTTSAPIFRPKKSHFGWRDFFLDENFGPPSSRQRNCRRTSFEEVEWRTGASAHRVCHLQSCPWFWQMRPPGRSSESTQKMKFQFYKIGFFCIGIPEDYFCWS